MYSRIILFLVSELNRLCSFRMGKPGSPENWPAGVSGEKDIQVSQPTCLHHNLTLVKSKTTDWSALRTSKKIGSDMQTFVIALRAAIFGYNCYDHQSTSGGMPEMLRRAE